MPRPCSRLSLAASLALLGCAAAPVAASAASASTACKQERTTMAFAGVDGDPAEYSAAPGGTFESGTTGWTLADGARLGTGNESLVVSKGSRSLVLPVGASATSPTFCVDQTKPHFRFAYRVDSVGMTGFQAEVLYKTASGERSTKIFSSREVPVQLIGSGWQPSPKSPLATLIPLSGGTAQVRVRLTGITIAGDNFATQTLGRGLAAIGSPLANIGASIDSVMVDPYRRS